GGSDACCDATARSSFSEQPWSACFHEKRRKKPLVISPKAEGAATAMHPPRAAAKFQDSGGRRRGASDSNGPALGISVNSMSMLAAESRGNGGSASDSSCATASPMSIASPTNGSNANSSSPGGISRGSFSGGP